MEPAREPETGRPGLRLVPGSLRRLCRGSVSTFTVLINLLTDSSAGVLVTSSTVGLVWFQLLLLRRNRSRDTHVSLGRAHVSLAQLHEGQPDCASVAEVLMAELRSNDPDQSKRRQQEVKPRFTKLA